MIPTNNAANKPVKNGFIPSFFRAIAVCSALECGPPNLLSSIILKILIIQKIVVLYFGELIINYYSRFYNKPCLSLVM